MGVLVCECMANLMLTFIIDKPIGSFSILISIDLCLLHDHIPLNFSTLLMVHLNIFCLQIHIATSKLYFILHYLLFLSFFSLSFLFFIFNSPWYVCFSSCFSDWFSQAVLLSFPSSLPYSWSYSIFWHACYPLLDIHHISPFLLRIYLPIKKI